MTRGRVSCVALAYLVRMARTKPRFAWYRQFTLCGFFTSAQPDPGLSPEEMFLPLERKRIVSAAIQKLTPTLRTAMEPREVGDLSIRETAGIMGLSVGTV
jgi:DNA-directed RNA polymerase specialized sigma24 family protein